ncbi:MAG: hypothetical protein IJV46_08995 [Acidaminococcaceae bacterium]|nr:hypothetical protein [Acidaminococcaceae bacterium]
MMIKSILQKVFLAVLLTVIQFSVSEAATGFGDIKQIGFGNIAVPAYVSNDEFIIKSLYFAVKDEAKKLKNIKLDYTGDSKEKDDGIIEIVLNQYELKPYWFEPTVTTTDKVVESRTYEWTDKNGKKKTATVEKHRSEPVGKPGGYGFSAYVSAIIYLKDVKTGDYLLLYEDNTKNDREIDGFRSILRGFYKELNGKIKQGKKG